MTFTDLVLVALLVFSLYYGYRNGLINVLANLASLVLAYLVARLYAVPLGTALVSVFPQPELGTIENNTGSLIVSLLFQNQGTLVNRLANIVCFVVIFLVVRWAIRKLADLISDFFHHGLLGTINHFLGALLAFILMLILIIICLDIVSPVLTQLGIDSRAFFANSKIIIPLIRDLQYLHP